MNGLACQVHETEYAAVIAASGSVDLATCDHLAAETTRHLWPGGRLVIDCSGVEFLDSMVLRALLDVQRQAAFVGSVFALAAVPRPVRTVLELTGTERHFLILDRPPDTEAADGAVRTTCVGDG
jgi:anti-anti-sigma factor